MAKDIIGKDKFIEVFIDTPLSLAEKRDPKVLKTLDVLLQRLNK